MNKILNQLQTRLECLKELRKDKEGMYVNRNSLGQVLVEHGYGINDTDCSFHYEKALFFSNKEDAYRAGDFYLVTQRNGKKVPVYVNEQKAEEFLDQAIEDVKSTISAFENAIAERMYV